MIDKILFLFDSSEKKKLILVTILIIVGAIFEVISIGLLALFIGVAIEGDFTAITNISENIGLGAVQEDIVYQIAMVTALFFLLKNVYQAIANYVFHKFIYGKYTEISLRLLGGYLTMPYTEHIGRSSAELQRNVNTEVFWLFANVMIPMITISTEVVVVAVIMISLLILDPTGTIYLMLGFGVVIYFVMRVIKSKMTALGAKSQHHFGGMINVVNHSLGDLKLTKVSDLAGYILNKYRENIIIYSSNAAKLKNISQWPRYVAEVIVVIAATVAITVFQGEGQQGDLSKIGFFAVAAIRLMPSFNRITSAYTSIKYYSASLNVVYNEISCESWSDQQKTEFSSNVELDYNKTIFLDNVSFKYPGENVAVIDGLTIEISKGQSLAFIGASGAGKTTIVDLICGLLSPSEGRILVDGIDISQNMPGWRKRIAYVPQSIYIYDDTIINNIAYGVSDSDIDVQKVMMAAKMAMLDEYIADLENGYESYVGENGMKMSGGQRQRLGIARALYSDPDVLILDEGTSALDNESQDYIVDSIGKLSGATVITIAHRLSSIDKCDVIYMIEKGKIKKVLEKGEISQIDRSIIESIENE